MKYCYFIFYVILDTHNVVTCKIVGQADCDKLDLNHHIVFILEKKDDLSMVSCGSYI